MSDSFIPPCGAAATDPRKPTQDEVNTVRLQWETRTGRVSFSLPRRVQAVFHLREEIKIQRRRMREAEDDYLKARRFVAVYDGSAELKAAILGMDHAPPSPMPPACQHRHGHNGRPWRGRDAIDVNHDAGFLKCGICGKEWKAEGYSLAFRYGGRSDNRMFTLAECRAEQERLCAPYLEAKAACAVAEKTLLKADKQREDEITFRCELEAMRRRGASRKDLIWACNKRKSDQLSDSYVKRMLGLQGMRDVPEILLETKRIQTKIKRRINNPRSEQ